MSYARSPPLPFTPDRLQSQTPNPSGGCEAGKISKGLSVSCTSCAAGTYSYARAAGCTNCTEGERRGVGGGAGDAQTASLTTTMTTTPPAKGATRPAPRRTHAMRAVKASISRNRARRAVWTAAPAPTSRRQARRAAPTVREASAFFAIAHDLNSLHHHQVSPAAPRARQPAHSPAPSAPQVSGAMH